ncbi:hypothetical protein D3C72_1317620 [compost metagenome]
MCHPAPVIELVQPTSAAEQALAEIRAMFGRNTTAYRWSRLPVKTKDLICRAARLPDEARWLELDAFEIEQQEVIRLTLRDLMPALQVFSGTALDRRVWYRTNRPSHTQRTPVTPAAPPEPVSRDDQLASRKALMRKINGQSGQSPEPQAPNDEV